MSFLPSQPAAPHSGDESAGSERDAALPVTDDATANTKAALLGHTPSLNAYLEWYTLRDELGQVIGTRGVTLFGLAISDATGSEISQSYFRSRLVEAGEDPDAPERDERDALLAEFGHLMATSPGEIPDEIYAQLEQLFEPWQRVLLVAFGGLMIATDVFNLAGRVPVDLALHPFQRGQGTEPEVEMGSAEAGAD